MVKITAEELNRKLESSYKQSLEGKGRPFDEVFDEILADISGKIKLKILEGNNGEDEV